MKILSINKQNVSTSFQANVTKKALREMNNKALREINKKALEIQKKQLTQASYLPSSAVILGKFIDFDNYFKSKGFTYISEDGNVLNLASGYNGGHYIIELNGVNMPNGIKDYVVKLLMHDPYALGGLLNYKECIQDLKRQDIVKKGLGIHTYKLNTDINVKQSYIAAKHFSKHLNKTVEYYDLFFINSEAFYYDKNCRTIYSLILDNYSEKSPKSIVKETYFIADKNNNTIGYKSKKYSPYFRRDIEEIYTEQLEPGHKLKTIVDYRNNKEFAEAFRFGNNESDLKKKKAAVNILNHLSNRVKIKSPTIEDIQYIKFEDSNKNIITRFGYYDQTVGRSFIYNEEGKYMYQMEYIRDENGNITACSRL